MSPTPNRSSGLQHFERGNGIIHFDHHYHARSVVTQNFLICEFLPGTATYNISVELDQLLSLTRSWGRGMQSLMLTPPFGKFTAYTSYILTVEPAISAVLQQLMMSCQQ